MRPSFETGISGDVPPSAPDNPAAPVCAAHLKVVPSVQGKLTAAQQRFNKLLAKVDSLGRKLQDFARLADKVRGPHLDRMAELERAMAEGRWQMVLFLHARLQRKGLTAAQQKTARQMVQALLPPPQGAEGTEGADGVAPADAAVLAQLRAAYAPDTAQPVQDSELFAHMMDMAESALGRPLDREALQGMESPQQLMEALLGQVQAHGEAEQERLAAHRAQRPTTPRQRKIQEQEQDAKAALRSIYRQLASALHPDREPDPAERQRKGALMVQANTAYERGDLMALLGLQLQVEQVDAAHIARMAEDKIAALSLLLKQQVAALEEQLLEAELRLGHELGVAVTASMKEASLRRLLQREQHMHADWVEQMHADLQRVRDDAQFKRWLREQADLARCQAQEEERWPGPGIFF